MGPTQETHSTPRGGPAGEGPEVRGSSEIQQDDFILSDASRMNNLLWLEALSLGQGGGC